MGRRAYLSRFAFDRALAAVLAIAMFATQWYRHATFRSGTFDLAVFEQVVWKMAHGHGASSTLTGWNTFGDHFSPALLVFVPLYLLAATPLWFFAAQALAAGIGLLCVRPLVAATGTETRDGLATALVVAYALNPALWNAVLFDFHTSTLAVPLLLIGCTAGLRQRYVAMWLVLLGLVLLRDDLALAAVPLALVGWTTATRAGRRARVALASLGVGWMILGAQIGTALGASRHFAARYGYLGDSMTDAATHPVHTIGALAAHVFATNNIPLVLALLLPLALLPLGKPGWAALAAVMALPTLVATDVNMHSPSFQYGAPILPFLILAAAGALPKLRATWRSRAVILGAPFVLTCFWLVGPPTTGTLAYATVPAADARAALRTIHPGDVVVASPFLASHVADRPTVIAFPWPFRDASHQFPLDPRVTDVSQARRDSVDVIVVGPGADMSPDLIAEVLHDSEVTAAFTRQQFGDVTVLRRLSKAGSTVSH